MNEYERLKRFKKRLNKIKEFKKLFYIFITVEQCKEYLKYNDVNKIDDVYQNILFYQLNLDVIKYLIENTNINVNHLDNNNRNILFYQYDLEVIKYLVENTGIDIKCYLNNSININDKYYNYIKSFYEARELEKELNKITQIKKDKEKVKKI